MNINENHDEIVVVIINWVKVKKNSRLTAIYDGKGENAGEIHLIIKYNCSHNDYILFYSIQVTNEEAILLVFDKIQGQRIDREFVLILNYI